ncbi:MAG TPA: c-type cytochrome, partial [Methylomirabilota bacterium]|nr:c-type cytochrome [Methylomirabilota bacterium]
LRALIRDEALDAIGLNPAALHALWTLRGLGVLDQSGHEASQAAFDALKHGSAPVRRAAALVLPRDATARDQLINSGLLNDSDAQTRLAALLALSEMPAGDDAGSAVFAMLKQPANSDDRWISDGAIAAAARHDAGFLRAALAGFRPKSAGSTEPDPGNLISNPSFENETSGSPLEWRTVTHGGRADFALASSGRTGARSVQISSERGADASWSTTVSVQPRTRYRLSAWIKTEDVTRVGNSGMGALLNVHELQDPENGATRPLTGSLDWTEVEMIFDTGERTQVTINCLFGGWGRARGTAWFDDVQLTQAGGAGLPGEVGRVVQVVTTHYAQRGPVDSIVSTLAALDGAPASVMVPILDGLVEGWPGGRAPALSQSDRHTLTALMGNLPETARDRLLVLAQQWGEAELFGANFAAILGALRGRIADGSLEDDLRVNAAERLLRLRDEPESIQLMLNQITPLTPPAIGMGLINALAGSRDDATGKALTGHWNELTPSLRRAAVAVLMRRTEWTSDLLEAVANDAVARGDVAAEHWSQLQQNPNRRIARRAERLAADQPGVSADREEVVQRLLPLADEPGNPVRGREVYTANCAVCHVFNGEGGIIGPALTGINARDPKDVLLEILDPNRSVEANYQLWTAMTRDGEIFSGRMEAETQTTVEILDTTGRKHVIQRKDITSLAGSPLSIMPTGFEALPEDDLKALLAYLAESHP